MDRKKIGKALLFPRILIMVLLTPVSIALLVYSMVVLGTENIISYISYAFSAYMLTVWSLRAPEVIQRARRFLDENKYAKRWRSDPRLRVNTSLFFSIFINTAFAIFQFCLGIKHKSFWFYSLAAYYLCLGVMRFFLFQYTKKHKPGERMRKELVKYRNCGWVFLVINLTLSLMLFFMIRFDRTFVHHEITTITIAAYTFTALTLAIINVIKFRKYNSPAFFASKAISLAAACVSVITLEATMLTTFGDIENDATMRRILLAVSGGAISVFLIFMAVYVIVQSTRKLKALKSEGVIDADK